MHSQETAPKKWVLRSVDKNTYKICVKQLEDRVTSTLYFLRSFAYMIDGRVFGELVSSCNEQALTIYVGGSYFLVTQLFAWSLGEPVSSCNE